MDSFAFNLWPTDLQEKLYSFEDLRISDMERGEVAVQVVSAVLSAEISPVCQPTNNQLQNAIVKSPGRLKGFATVPMRDPKEACRLPTKGRPAASYFSPDLIHNQVEHRCLIDSHIPFLKGGE